MVLRGLREELPFSLAESDKVAQAWPVKRGENPSLWEFIRMKQDC